MLSSFLLSLLPAGAERYLFAFGAAAGVVLDFLFGTGWHGDSFLWLVILMVADWITGMGAAIQAGTVSSEAGFIGLLRKGVIFFVVAIAHSFDVASGIGFVESAVVCAYIVNEGVSIVENLALLGYESYIPAPILAALKTAKEASDQKLEDLTKELKK